MSKHPHRLILLQKKTWRCTREGCRFFVHVGLAHLLIGRQSICWECGEEFTFSDRSLKEEQPICDDCFTVLKGGMTTKELATVAEVKETLSKANVESESELTPVQRTILEMLGKLPGKK